MDADPAIAQQLSLADENTHAQTLEPHREIIADAGDDLVLVRHCRHEIPAHPADQAATLQAINILDQRGQVNQGFFRDTALIQASAARQSFLHQRHFRPQVSGGDRSLVSSRAAADDYEIKFHPLKKRGNPGSD